MDLNDNIRLIVDRLPDVQNTVGIVCDSMNYYHCLRKFTIEISVFLGLIAPAQEEKWKNLT